MAWWRANTATPTGDKVHPTEQAIIEAAIAMADALEAEAGADERKLQSNVTARRTAATKTQEIRRLVKLLHQEESNGSVRTVHSLGYPTSVGNYQGAHDLSRK